MDRRRLNDIPADFFKDIHVPVSKRRCLKMLKNNNKQKRDFADENELKNYIQFMYYSQQIDNIMLLYDSNSQIKNYLNKKLKNHSSS